MRAREKAEYLARVAVAVDLQNHAAGRDNRHPAKLCEAQTTGNHGPLNGINEAECPLIRIPRLPRPRDYRLSQLQRVARQKQS